MIETLTRSRSMEKRAPEKDMRVAVKIERGPLTVALGPGYGVVAEIAPAA